MRKTEIALVKPFEGSPKINLADVFGASPNKPVTLRIPVTGQRPVTISALNLPKGLAMDGCVLRGSVAAEGDYTITLSAENALGRTEKQLTLEIHPNHVLLTPLLGFTSWNAFGTAVNQNKMVHIANRMVELGITEYGYSYLNIDSSWQGEYGGKHDAIQPNCRFPDMKQMCDDIHALGLKCGIYATPMLTAWGCPPERESIPGCTQGEPDDRFAPVNGGVGLIHKERNNARQWAEWGMDYLKYDWYPSDPVLADLMLKELQATDRDFGYCITVHAMKHYRQYWEKHASSYRCNTDCLGNWNNLMEMYREACAYEPRVIKGHFYDFDMLDVGQCCQEGKNDQMFVLTEDEQLVSYTMRVLLSTPLQISSILEDISDFELSMYCNEEILAIHQDTLFDTPRRLPQAEPACGTVHVYEKRLADGSRALMVFNLGETEQAVNLTAEKQAVFRDVWAKRDIKDGKMLSYQSHPHTVRVWKVIQMEG